MLVVEMRYLKRSTILQPRSLRHFRRIAQLVVWPGRILPDSALTFRPVSLITVSHVEQLSHGFNPRPADATVFRLSRAANVDATAVFAAVHCEGSVKRVARRYIEVNGWREDGNRQQRWRHGE